MSRHMPIRISTRIAWLANALLSSTLIASALALAAAESPFHDQPASARSVPADNLPPFGMLDEHGNLLPTPPMPASALNRGPGSAPETSVRGPTLAMAVTAARAAVNSCNTAGYRIGVAVVDSAGEARALLSADGADGSHVYVAVRKALVALAFSMPSSQAKQQVLKDRASLARVTPSMFVEGGAVPIRVGDAVIGAIGVSGAGGKVIGQQDERCAIAGLERIRQRLK
jgi:uncharacterized protein GlcG (DUF336 family)